MKANRHIADLAQIRKAEEAARLTPEDFEEIALGVLSPGGLGRHLLADSRRASEWQQSLYAAGHCLHAKREQTKGGPRSCELQRVLSLRERSGAARRSISLPPGVEGRMIVQRVPFHLVRWAIKMPGLRGRPYRGRQVALSGRCFGVYWPM